VIFHSRRQPAVGDIDPDGEIETSSFEFRTSRLTEQLNDVHVVCGIVRIALRRGQRDLVQ